MPSVTTDTPAITTTWPAGFKAERPGVSTFAVREVAAPADVVFDWARRIDLHPQFYPGLRAVRRIGGAWPAIDKGTKLAFLVGTTYVPYVAVLECNREARSFAWGGGVPGVSICHVFTVAAVDQTRSLIRSEERWVGPIATASAALVRGPMQKVQTQWAEAIARAASQHPGGPPTA